MKNKIDELIDLVDSALKMAQKMQVNEESDGLNRIISSLESLKDRALAGQLEPSQGTLNLGLTRQLSDWIESLDSPLLKAVGGIEEYYRENL